MASRVIALRGEPIVDEQEVASAAITPGDLIEISSGKWRRHASAAGRAQTVFALERDELGRGIDTDYAADEQVKAGYFKPGDRVNAWIGSGQNLLRGAELESDGAGGLRALSGSAPIARSAEDSGAVLVRTRHKVIVL